MEHSPKKRNPNIVRVTCIRRGGFEIHPKEQFVGFMVDEAGNDMETPEVGTPLFLAGDDSNRPWLFATDPVYRLDIYPEHWDVITESGVFYEVTNERIVQ